MKDDNTAPTDLLKSFGISFKIRPIRSFSQWDITYFFCVRYFPKGVFPSFSNSNFPKVRSLEAPQAAIEAFFLGLGGRALQLESVEGAIFEARTDWESCRLGKAFGKVPNIIFFTYSSHIKTF